MRLLLAKFIGMLGADGDLGEFEWVNQIVAVINDILWPVLILVAAAGTIYAVVLGVNMARADSTEKREEAKKRVINVLVGMAIIIGLILLLKLFMGTVLPAFINKEDPLKEVEEGKQLIGLLRR